MRKLLLTGLVILGLAAGAKAQKGTTLLYGNVDLTTMKDYSQVGFNPGVGFGFGENWTVGANLGIYAAKDKNPGFQAGPFLRYTKKLSEVFSLFGQLNAGYANVEGVFTGNMNGFPMVDGNPELKGNGFGANITPAIFINVKNGFGVNINFGGIGFESFKYDGSSSASTFGLTFGRGAGLGISKTFGGKK
ncbi:hypothetical protein QTN47_01195 [Danxiaibacter flavus]|uniref:Outer membrane protein beta-barrel domain-containing protein n=1 Tax=Danxiaibacter flavus TaxID=3049108 RepID=A0ABV3Z8A2_9BACT|nr:hypothetical protein QNM32_01195 [Chitinophagaceae bacterium DXS]